MAVTFPTVDKAIFLEALFDQPRWAEIMASGIIDGEAWADTGGPGTKPGDTINIPELNEPAAYARVDVGSSTDLTPTAIATVDDKAVIMRDVSMNEYKRNDLVGTGQDLVNKLMPGFGNRLAKRFIAQVSRVLIGALEAQSTGGAHVNNVFNAADPAVALATVERVRATLGLMGDEADQMTTAIVHSKVWQDLLKDMIANFKIDVVGGQVINSGRLRTLMGIENWIITDQIITPEAVGSSAGSTQFYTFFLRPDAMFQTFQDGPLMETDEDLLKPSTLHYIKSSIDYTIHLKKMKWNPTVALTVNPKDADLTVSGNWAEAFNDHRQVGAVALKSNAIG